MFLNTLIQVSACVADMIYITQITLEIVYNALLIHNRGFLSLGLVLNPIFWLDTGWISVPILWLNSPSCLRTEFVGLWSLNVILTGAFFSSRICLDLKSPGTFAVTKILIVDCKSRAGYRSREKVCVRRLHSKWNSCQLDESLKARFNIILSSDCLYLTSTWLW